MNISSSIQALLSDEISTDQQYSIIEKLNKKVFEQNTLYEIAQEFLKHSINIENPFNDTLDIVGTGGDGMHTLNYSTLSALVAHETGAKIAKHGNKSATSKCGSFDFIQHLNIEIPTTAQQAEQQLKDERLTWLFAPYFHPIFAKVAKARAYFAEKGEKTFFNALAPLLNPMKVKRILAGVYDERLLQPYAYAFEKMGITHAYIVYGDGMDEFTICGINKVIQLHNGKKTIFTLHPEQVGMVRSKSEYLQAGDASTNFSESQDIFKNELLGPKQDTLILNSAAASHIASGFTDTLADHVSNIKQKFNTKYFIDLLS